MMKLIGLFFQAVSLIMQWMNVRKDVSREQALRELTEALNDRIKAATDARMQPHNYSVPDPFDRAGPPRSRDRGPHLL